MPTNANTFNSRVTSEALEAKFRQVFPSQGGAELPQDLFASGVIQPVIDFSTVAEGSVLAPNLQTAWDFSTGSVQLTTTSYTTIINNTGFWLVDLVASVLNSNASANRFSSVIRINDGSTQKPIWGQTNSVNLINQGISLLEGKFVVFLRAGDTLEGKCGLNDDTIDIWYRQIADVNGNLTNPLGFSFS